MDDDPSFYECDGCSFKSISPRRCPRCGGRIDRPDSPDS